MKDFTNYIPPSWDELFMGKVYEIARKSKDPKTKIGAVLVKTGKSPHAPLEGFNGICVGVKDLQERLERPEKYHWMEHAERNVMYMAAKFGISTYDGTLYTQGLPCTDCMRAIINCGLTEVVLHKQWEDISRKIIDTSYWRNNYFRSSIMAEESGIAIRFVDCVLGKIGYLDGKSFSV